MENDTNQNSTEAKVEQAPVTPPMNPPAPAGSQGGYDSKGGYAKGGWKKWLWIYIVVAVVVYGAVYYYVKHRNSSTGGTTSSSLY